MALSLERWLEIADSKKRLDKYSQKFKVACALLYILIVWLVSLFFSLPMILSFKEGFSLDGSFVCDSKWDDNEVIFSIFLIHYLNLFIRIIFHLRFIYFLSSNI